MTLKRYTNKKPQYKFETQLRVILLRMLFINVICFPYKI